MRSDKFTLLAKSRNFKEVTIFLLTLTTCFASGMATADDTEIFYKSGPQPNVLFVLDVSGSMKEVDNNDGVSRLDKLKTALNTLLNTNDSFNAGLMSYSGNAIRLLEEVGPVADTKTQLLNSIDALSANGGTPTQRALYESMLYFRGEETWTGRPRKTFTSPISIQCQSNHVVLLSDGYPSVDFKAYNKIESAIDADCDGVNVGDGLENGNCGSELAQYMNTTDHSSLINGLDNITTHTIGLEFDEDWLGTIATGGGGGHYTASSAEDLLEAFANIVEVAHTEGTSFVSPAVTVDQFSRLAHREDTYLALFQPTNKAQWKGNLKKYSFSGDPAVLRDENDNVAIDSDTGKLLDTARSYWSETADGAVVANGGAANELNAADRNVYTYTGTNEKNLNHLNNAVHEDNVNKLKQFFSISDSELPNLLTWARGVDVKDEDEDGFTNDTRQHMGDPLHSAPTVLSYGGTADSPDSNSVVFVATNEGYLHAIDSTNGKELYSYIPAELLDNLDVFYQNNTGGTRPYGLDGDITLKVYDKNNDGALDPLTDHAHLFVGMRRGGDNYYALDVTEKENPKFLWMINGGADGDEDFVELSQSWSKPTLARIKIGSSVKDVLIFGGGYDPMQDYASIRSADTIGKSLFIVDAADGSLLWKPSMDTVSDYSKMNYSMPSDPRLLDVDDDGLVDQIYIGDMGGQIWRFDLKHDSSSASDTVRGGLIASLSGPGISDNRRFFYPPDVAFTAHGDMRYISVSIGSGNRAHPLDETVNDRFYMIRQEAIYGPPAGYGIIATTATANATATATANAVATATANATATAIATATTNTTATATAETSTTATYRAIVEADLYDATENNINSTDRDVSLNAEQTLRARQGWMLKLEEAGEKVLSSSLTIENTILFATYIPGQVNTEEPCAPAIGGGRAYVVSLFDASPANGVQAADRFQELKQSGIAGGPNGVILSNGTFQPRVGGEPVDMPVISLTKRLYWSEQLEF